MITTRLRRTVHENDRITVGNSRWFGLLRAGDWNGQRCVEVITPRPDSPFLLQSRPVKEGERHEVYPKIFLTVLDASKQSRVQVMVEAPLSEAVRQIKGRRHAETFLRESGLFRSAKFEARGILYLHSMPGRYEPMERTTEEMQRCGIDRIVCLAPLGEIQKKSPSYAGVLSQGVAWHHDSLPIEDFGVPTQADAFWSLASDIAAAIQDGDRVLVHCAGGIGRTGSFAVAVGLKLGLSLDEAIRIVRAAGSGPETPAQRALLSSTA